MSGTSLALHIVVQNLAFSKTVGIDYTTDNWATVQTALASFGSAMIGSCEEWSLTIPIGSASAMEFAIFYQVLGTQFWDNNFGQNHHVTAGNPVGWGGLPLN